MRYYILRYFVGMLVLFGTVFAAICFPEEQSFDSKFLRITNYVTTSDEVHALLGKPDKIIPPHLEPILPRQDGTVLEPQFFTNPPEQWVYQRNGTIYTLKIQHHRNRRSLVVYKTQLRTIRQ